MRKNVNLPLLVVTATVATLLTITPSGFVAHAATVTVTTLTDENDHSCTDGDCSLRDAIEVAAAGDTINFSVTGTITLTLGPLAIGKNLTISGPGAGNLTVSGNNTSRVFFMKNSSINLTISGMTIANGSATDGGGGIFNMGGALTVINCTFSNNHGGTGAWADGGGIHNGDPGTLTVMGSTFSNNTAGDGGAIHNRFGTVTVTDSTFSGNSATYGEGGGAVHNYGGSVNVTNSTFSGNSAAASMWGGGIYSGGTLTVTNSTFSGNSAASGGGFYNDWGTVTFINTIVANSTSGGNCAGDSFTVASTNNLATDATCTPGFTQTTDVALNLVWGSCSSGLGVFSLGSGSVAIDTGTNTGCPATDQCGRSRPQDGDGNGTAICDVGAYELGEIVPIRLYLPLILRNAP